MKACSKCRVTKVIDDFGIDRKRKDGRYPACRECVRVAAAVCRSKPGYAEKQAVRTKAWRERNAERSKEMAKAYRNRPEVKERTAAWRAAKLAANPDHFREMSRRNALAAYHRQPDHRKRAHLLKRYGLTLAAFDEMLRAQDGGCAVCGLTDPPNPRPNATPWCVDHCHTTNRVRSILCNRCNTVVGMLNEQADLAARVEMYIRERCDPIKPR